MYSGTGRNYDRRGCVLGPYEKWEEINQNDAGAKNCFR